MQGTPISNNVIDLGTPSAPPIIDIGREGNKSEAESEPIEDSGGLTETERSVDDGIHMPKESAHVFRGNKEVSSDWRVQSLKDEHVERYNI